MHERSLVRKLLEHVDAIRRGNGAETVAEVRVEVGSLSGVEPALLAGAFDELAAGGPAAGATLVMDQVGLVAACRACATEFAVVGFVFRCPACQGNVRITRGDELLLTGVTLRDRNVLQETVS